MRGEARTLIRAAALACAAVLLVGWPSSSIAARRARWVSKGHSEIPLRFFQGITSDPQKHLYFDGIFTGLYRTNIRLHQEATNFSVIPASVVTSEGYDHIGDITWDRGEGGRILLPLECYSLTGGNTCKSGSIGVADPRTLQWRYYVKLDPAFIDKAMWAEVSPDGKLLWTSSGSGNDLLAYRTADISPPNAGPTGPALKPVIRLAGKVPPSGITGATFYRRRLLLSGQRRGPFQVWSVDTRNGSRRLEIERHIIGESEGLDIVRAQGGLLHWVVTPFGTSGRPPTYGSGHNALLNFAPRGLHGARKHR